MPTMTIDKRDVRMLLTKLLERKVDLQPVDEVSPVLQVSHGLVTDDHQLVAVIGADLDFARRTAAALAMIPASTLDFSSDDADDNLIEFYHEVANVLSRAANEASPYRLRLDPDIQHSDAALQTGFDRGVALVSLCATIEEYGSGNVGIWVSPGLLA